MSTPRPRCAACSHPLAYHRGPQCLGGALLTIGFAQPGEERCACTYGPDDAPEALTTTCPFCGDQPYAAVSPTQWACANDACPCFLWNPEKSREENRRNAAPVQVTEKPIGEDR